MKQVELKRLINGMTAEMTDLHALAVELVGVMRAAQKWVGTSPRMMNDEDHAALTKIEKRYSAALQKALQVKL